MTSRAFEVGIFGGGPAASLLAARLASKGLRTVVFARETKSGKFTEHVPPSLVQRFTSLGLGGCLAAATIAQSPGIVARWGSAERSRTDYIRQPAGRGYHIQRSTLDSALLKEAEHAGAEVCSFKTVAEFEQRGSVAEFEVVVNTTGGRKKIRCANLVDATGRIRWLARRLGIKTVGGDRLVAVQSHIATANTDGSWLCIESFPNGWSYSTPIEQIGSEIVLVTDVQSLRERRFSATSVFPKAPRVGSIDVHCRSASTERLEVAAGRGWLAVGDAAIRLDPLTGSGLLWSCESAERAADAIVDGPITESSARDYSAFVAATWASYCVQRRQFYKAEQRWPTSGFWQRRQQWTGVGLATT